MIREDSGERSEGTEGILPYDDDTQTHRQQRNQSYAKLDNISTHNPSVDENTIDELLEDFRVTSDTQCGFGWLASIRFLQYFANERWYCFLYGLVGLFFSANYSYFSGIISTIEKRFHISSQTTGLISIGNNVIQVLITITLTYFGSKGHRPRWVAIGICGVALHCFLEIMPHMIYGSGEDALALTYEYGGHATNYTDIEHELCKDKPDDGRDCDKEDNNLVPIIIIFIAKLISGIGSPLYYTLGVSYMDDNILKSKSPGFMSVSYFLGLFGPAIGFALSSYCLTIYISPYLTPVINLNDPRWLGAYWTGWIFLTLILILTAFLLSLFPKTLPRAAVRKMVQQQQNPEHTTETDAVSFADMYATLKRIVKIPAFMFNVCSNVFYYFGWMPYWTFMPKYIETQYRTSASAASMITGSGGLISSAFGILIAGLLITKFKPSARRLAFWNILSSIFCICGLVSYIFMGCHQSEMIQLNQDSHFDVSLDCNSNCHCEFVKYSPVCSWDKNLTFISPCHAGCTDFTLIEEQKHFENCSCIPTENESVGGSATDGPCPVDCSTQLYTFIAIFCIIQFVNASQMASDFLVSARSVDEKDKSVSFAFGLSMNCLLAFLPSPIVFGHILDTTCLVWGKTCSGTGNCWHYDGERLRYTFNLTAAGFILIGVFLDCGVWYHVKHIKVFDEPEKENAKNSDDEE